MPTLDLTPAAFAAQARALVREWKLTGDALVYLSDRIAAALGAVCDAARAEAAPKCPTHNRALTHCFYCVSAAEIKAKEAAREQERDLKCAWDSRACEAHQPLYAEQEECPFCHAVKLAEELKKERWQHAACLSIAEGAPGWKEVSQREVSSVAMRVVGNLRTAYLERVEEVRQLRELRELVKPALHWDTDEARRAIPVGHRYGGLLPGRTCRQCELLAATEPPHG